MKLNTLFLIGTTALMISCSGDSSQKTGKESNGKDQYSLEEEDLTEDLQIISLPTPLQIPALMKNYLKEYSSDHLTPINKERLTSYESSILLGTYLFDMTYCGLYSHHQKSLDYFKECIDLSEQIGIEGNIRESDIHKFKQNISNQDSLAQIILGIYDRGHKVLMDQEKDDLGMLVLLGCYMEGMYLAVNQLESDDYTLFLHTLSLQKKYGENLYIMLSHYGIPPTVKFQYDNFVHLQEILDEYELPTLPEMRADREKTRKLNRKLIQELEKITTEFRSSLIA